MSKSRGKENTVTTLPVLVPAKDGRSDGSATWEDHFGLFHPVQQLRHGDLRPILKSLDARDLKRFQGLTTLRQALKTPDVLLAKKLAGSYGPLLRDIARRYFEELHLPVAQHDLQAIAWFLMSGNRRDTAAAILSQLLTSELSKAKLVMWRTHAGAIPAIYCDDARTALFVYVAVVGRLGICPHCDDVFVKKRPDQDYCKIAHREAHRVARWREENKVNTRR